MTPGLQHIAAAAQEFIVKFSLPLLLVVIVVELAWLGGMEEYVDRYSASIEASEIHSP